MQKKENSRENKDEGEKEPPKLTEEDILMYSIVRNGLRQQINVSNKIFLKHNERKPFFLKNYYL